MLKRAEKNEAEALHRLSKSTFTLSIKLPLEANRDMAKKYADMVCSAIKNASVAGSSVIKTSRNYWLKVSIKPGEKTIYDAMSAAAQDVLETVDEICVQKSSMLSVDSYFLADDYQKAIYFDGNGLFIKKYRLNNNKTELFAINTWI